MDEKDEYMNFNEDVTSGTQGGEPPVQTTAFTMVSGEATSDGNEQDINRIEERKPSEVSQASFEEVKRQQTEAHYEAYHQIPVQDIPLQDVKKKEKKAKKMGAFLAKAALFGLIAGGMFAGVNRAADYFYPSRLNESAKQVIATTNTASGSGASGIIATDVSDVVEAVMPSIVSVVSRVSTTNQYKGYGFFFGIPQEYDASGSGFIVGQSDTELLIATNNHVIDGAKTITVTFTDETPENSADDVSVEAILKGAAPETDLAVIAIPIENIPEEMLSYIKVATLGNSDTLRVGEGTIAIGNALGYGQSVTTGCVSAMNRQVTVENVTYEAIQTDAAINEGNSGGALLNMRGEVIGINSAKLASSGVEGMGYAIPISSAMDIINELMNRETRTLVEEQDRGYLGITGVDISQSYSDMYGIPSGISIQNVMPGSAADKAGIQKYDIITKFDGQSVNSMDELKNLIQYYKKGETVVITIQYAEGRNQYKETELEVKLGERTTQN